VIKAATEGLAWTASSRDLRIIVIAGNEPFTQGDVDYKQSVQAAVKKGVIVNTIFCGNEAEGSAPRGRMARCSARARTATSITTPRRCTSRPRRTRNSPSFPAS